MCTGGAGGKVGDAVRAQIAQRPGNFSYSIGGVPQNAGNANRGGRGSGRGSSIMSGLMGGNRQDMKTVLGGR